MIKNYVEFKSYFSGYDYVLVAFSGGVDSALVLKGAIDSLGTGRVLAVTANSPSLSDRARNEAIQLARELRCNHRLVTTEEWRKAQYRANGPDRCYHCKMELYQIMRLVERELPPSIIQGAENGRTTVLIANGANRDDVGDHRPGMQAATEHKIASPLLELGMTKQDVRNLAKAIGLNVWSKPAAPCLASRVPYHTEVTPHKLNQIEKAEDCLYALGFRDFRVRHHEVIAR
ncbi:MAG: ATP-dependent sacrificial sulfur transferase LarE, partial [Leptospiraceae bacterium]|nr:ATP-dependent sacrificial sulfur transferase LarE [Leptospiraceae bacterium]